MNMKSKKKDEIIAEYEDLLKELRSTQRLCRLNAEQAIKDFDEYKNVLGQINFYATRLRTGQYQSRDDVNADRAANPDDSWNLSDASCRGGCRWKPIIARRGCQTGERQALRAPPAPRRLAGRWRSRRAGCRRRPRAS